MKSKKLNNKQKILGAITTVAIVGGVIGAFLFLGGDTKTNTATDKPKTTPAIQEEVEIVDINSTSRPYAVMINNHADVRPYHMGLQDAYIVYEMIVEGGITRFLALFKDVETERIHGVRSARHYYLDYAMENDAFYIHWGGSPQAFSDLKTLDIDSMEVYDKKGASYDRTMNIAVEHTTYTSIATLDAAISSKNYREETNTDLLLNYSAPELDMSKYDDIEVANSVDIKYSSGFITNFKYNDETKTYMNSVNNKSHTDYLTKEQYHFKNIITYQVENSTIPGGGSGRQELDNIGSGTGYYISGGYAVPIKWKKTSRESQTKYTYMDGTELIVNDGNTYIAIQPKGETLTIK